MSSVQSIANNDDIILGKDLPNWKRYTGFLSVVVIYFFYCYNFMVGTFVKPTMLGELSTGGFAFTLQQSEAIFATMSLGTIPGTILFGILASKIGKKRTLITVAILIGATTFLPMLSPTSYTLWLIARFVTGVTLGGVFGAAQPLVAEMFPQKYRGKLAAIITSLFSIAMIFGGQIYAVLGDANWKILMYTAIIPPLIGAVLAFFFVPDDYEYTKNLNKEAKSKGKSINYFSMYKGQYLWIGIGVILLSGANFVAYSTFSNNATTYLREIGLTAAVAGGIYSLQGIGQLIGYNVWGYISDKFGRKVPLIGMAISAVGVFAYMQLGAQDVTMFKVVSLFIGFAVGFSGAWGAYYTELFPKEFSSMSSGISFNGGRIISTFAIPAVAGMATTGDMSIIFKVSIGVFIAGAVLWFFLPETLDKKNLKTMKS